MNTLSRRAFVQGSAAALASASLFGQDAAPDWKVGGFTKMLQDLSYEKTAEAAVEIGWDGIECPVRAKGHVLPERVDEDLPRMIEALKAKKLEMLVLATDIRGADEPNTAKVLKAAAKAGVKLYRFGGYRYKEGVSIAKQIGEFRARLKELGALSRELGLTGLYQNHSGNGYAGSAVWDIHEMIGDTEGLGVHFDIGHATVEQGLSWPTAFKLVQDRVKAVIVKDFYWKHAPGEGGKTQWCGIGKGSVNPKFFSMLRASGFQGPITMQFEYPLEGGDGLESRIKAMKEDNRVLRGWLKR
jgi:sugar phosphate isomerase/epimerase